MIGCGWLGGGPEPEPGGSFGLRALAPSGVCPRGPLWAWQLARAPGRFPAEGGGVRRQNNDLRHPRASLPAQVLLVSLSAEPTGVLRSVQRVRLG
jgi:hypothetical protein